MKYIVNVQGNFIILEIPRLVDGKCNNGHLLLGGCPFSDGADYPSCRLGWGITNYEKEYDMRPDPNGPCPRAEKRK